MFAKTVLVALALLSLAQGIPLNQEANKNPASEEAKDEALFADEGIAGADGYAEGVKGEEDDEYLRYLKEISQRMMDDSEYRDNVIADIEKKVAAGVDVEKEEMDVFLIAQDMFKNQDVRSALEEQKRQVINRQRRDHLRRIEKRIDNKIPREVHSLLFKDEEYQKARKKLNEHMNSSRNSKEDDISNVREERAGLLKEIDVLRRKAFQEHEMNRKLQFEEQLNATEDEDEKRKLKARWSRSNQARLKARGAEPGRRAELLNVWENKGFDRDAFNAKIFFKINDVDSNGILDEKEIESIHLQEATELHKDEEVEEEEKTSIVSEEVARMREHMLEFMDKDGDRTISQEEFTAAARSEDFSKNAVWNAVDPEHEIAKEQYLEFRSRSSRKRKSRDLDPRKLRVARDAWKDKLGEARAALGRAGNSISDAARGVVDAARSKLAKVEKTEGSGNDAQTDEGTKKGTDDGKLEVEPETENP